MSKHAAHLRARVFRFLDRLRSRGRSNMYGAVPYVMREFSLERLAAFELVCAWVDHDAARHDPAREEATRDIQPAPARGGIASGRSRPAAVGAGRVGGTRGGRGGRKPARSRAA
ncbi:MAG TPA: hypothetical protein VNK43_01650 [Gemmatimonadales bacterium]|nr:hypothetical protein [Gemmatimonadales bacterium]